MPSKFRPRSSVAVLAAATLFSGAAPAQTPATAPESDWTFTGNVGLYSQYVFRGISQTNEKPALQGGFDVGHKSGLYAGTWASNVRNNGFYDYGDWKVGISTEIHGVMVGIFGTGTDAENVAYTNRFGTDTSAGQFVAYLQKTF
jgi:hypothetical protein